MKCITNKNMEILPDNKQEGVVHMKNRIKWFASEDVVGYIEDKINGDVVVCFSDAFSPSGYIRFNLIKKGELFELKKED